MVRDAHYRAKLAHRARGLRELDASVGGITADIDARLQRGDAVRILELGCGYGTALLELCARYGNRVELHGLNRFPHDGNAEILARNAADHGLFQSTPANAREVPTIVHGDIAAGLPYADESFDIVYSQVAWLYFGRKLHVLREVVRVLRGDGLAKIDADELRPALPAEYSRLVEIWNGATLVPFGDYVARHGIALTAAPQGSYLRFGKVASIGADVEPLFEIDLSTINADWDGIKCVYRLRPVPLESPRDPHAASDRET